MMMSDTLDALNAFVRLGQPPQKAQDRSWSFPFVLTRRAVWLAVSAGSALMVSIAWFLWRAHLSGVDVVGTIQQGFAVSLVPLLGLGGWALLRTAAPIKPGFQAVCALDNFGDVTFMLDRSFALKSVSPALSHMFGTPAASVVGLNAMGMVHPADRAAVARLLAAMMAGQERAESLHRCRHTNGHWLWIAMDLRLVRHAGTARPEAILGVARDVTRWKHAEIRLEAANRRLAALALEDPVTGLANRRRFDDALTQEFRRAMRSGNPLALLMIDVDQFKHFNDAHGHQAGDACLRAIAGAMQDQTRRPGDVAARYGGEEFAILLPGTGLHGAAIMAERIRAAVQSEVVKVRGGAHSGVTVSIGVASIIPSPQHASSVELVHDADRALYAAKASGRNQVTIDKPQLPERVKTLPMVPAAG